MIKPLRCNEDIVMFGPKKDKETSLRIKVVSVTTDDWNE